MKSDIGYLMSDVFGRSGFGSQDFRAGQLTEKKIEDPVGLCLENVVELGRCRPDEKVASIQAAAFAWLAVDCTSVLSRERCVLELGALAQRLQFAANPVARERPDPADAESIKDALDQLVASLRAVEAAPDLGVEPLETSTATVRALALDREGALRLLRALNRLLERGEGAALMAPLRALRLDLARRSTALALRQACLDRAGRVRAAALDAGLRAFPAERAELLRWALVEPMDDVEERTHLSLAALEALAHYGLPPVPAGESPEHFKEVWAGLLVQVLYLQIDGPHSVAACRALAKITGEPTTLRPEVWVARERASARAAAPAADNETGTNP